MHKVSLRGTSGPIFDALLRLLGRWRGHHNYNGLPNLIQIIALREVEVWSTDVRLIRYLTEEMDAAYADLDHPLWAGNPPSPGSIVLRA